MKIPTTALMSVVLVLTTFTASRIPVFDVNVTNFPLDEQGNLKVSYGASKVITVEKDLNVSYPASHLIRRFTTAPVEVDGFKEMYLYVSVKNWTSNVDTFHPYPISIVDGIERAIPCEAGDRTTGWWWTWDGTPTNWVARYYIWGPVIKVFLYIQAESVGGSFLVSISLYLRN